MNTTIEANVREVRRRVEEACRRAGRSAGEVTIVGVTKTFGPDVVDALVDAGIADIGESRVQEYRNKRPAVSRPCRWHLIGTLQKNKARKAIGEFSLIHSVDSIDLASTLDRLGGESGLTTNVLLQVNTSGEETKHGFSPDEVRAAAGEIAGFEHVALEGFMTIGPFTDETASVRRAFETLRRVKEAVERDLGGALRHLSMGMSDDFEIAVEEGATMVRLGRILVGERPEVPPGAGG